MNQTNPSRALDPAPAETLPTPDVLCSESPQKEAFARTRASEATGAGIYYVATGHNYYLEARTSARSARKVMPEVKIAIYTDEVVVDSSLFDIRLGSGSFRHDFGEKIQALSQTPFSRTLFVDSDTFFCVACPEVFELLKKFDLMVAHDPARETYFRKESDIPAAFPELNTGVLAYNLNDRVQQLLRQWLLLHDLTENRSRYPHDQPTFRRALFESCLRFSILPPEYNARLIYPTMLSQEVKIIHARSNNLPALAKYLNANLRGEVVPRIYTWSFHQLLWTLLAFFHLRKGRGW